MRKKKKCICEEEEFVSRNSILSHTNDTLRNEFTKSFLWDFALKFSIFRSLFMLPTLILFWKIWMKEKNDQNDA